MIFTASDVESLSRSLSRWELGEYISEAFVIIACAGELVADLEASWLTKERKKHLQRRSTILLVAALSISLICLVRTNELSGSVIGSLGDNAEDADKKAVKALTDSGTAQRKADEASTVAGNALTKAGKAAESLEKAEDEAASAKKQAAEAESHLADALQRAADADQEALKATRELVKLKTPRSLSADQQERIKSKIKPFPEIPFDLWVSTDSDSTALLEIIDDTLRSAGWNFMPTGNPITFDNKAGIIASSGVSIHVPEEHRSEWESAIVALSNALIVEGLPAPPVSDTAEGEKDKKRDRIHVMIGSKPLN